jgi:hypothetical protein
VPTVKLIAGSKLPDPFPMNTEILFDGLSAAAKSIALSPLKSPLTIEYAPPVTV